MNFMVATLWAFGSGAAAAGIWMQPVHPVCLLRSLVGLGAVTRRVVRGPVPFLLLGFTSGGFVRAFRCLGALMLHAGRAVRAHGIDRSADLTADVQRKPTSTARSINYQPMSGNGRIASEPADTDERRDKLNEPTFLRSSDLVGDQLSRT